MEKLTLSALQYIILNALYVLDFYFIFSAKGILQLPEYFIFILICLMHKETNIFYSFYNNKC